jgi:hypothetical protein
LSIGLDLLAQAASLLKENCSGRTDAAAAALWAEAGSTPMKVAMARMVGSSQWPSLRTTRSWSQGKKRSQEATHGKKKKEKVRVDENSKHG